MKKHLFITIFSSLLISLTFVACKNNPKPKENAGRFETTIFPVVITEEIDVEDDSLYITATPDLDDDFYRHPDYPYFPDIDLETEKLMKLYAGKPDTIALGDAQETNEGGVITHQVALVGTFDENEEWLCIYMPGYSHIEYGGDPEVIVKTGITDTLSQDWLGDTITVLKGFEEKCIFINTAYKGYTEEDFEYLKQTEITDEDVIKQINHRVSRGIKDCEFMRYKQSEKLWLRALNSITIGERTIFIANYKKEEEDVILLIENDKVKPLNGYYQFYSEVFFYKLRDTVYMHLEESVYAGHTQTIWKLDPKTANHYEAISCINKTTD